MSVRHLHRIIICRVIKMESGIAAAPTRAVGRTTQPFVSAKIGSRPRNKMESGTAAAPARDGGKDDSTIRLG